MSNVARLPAVQAYFPTIVVFRAFCMTTGVTLEDLRGPSQARPISRLRHEVMYFLRQHTTLSLTDIGRHLGGRDMSSVHEGVAKVADRIGKDPDYRDRMRALQAAIVREALGRPGAADEPLAARVAASILQSPDLSDAEARKAALEVLLRALHPMQEVAHG